MSMFKKRVFISPASLFIVLRNNDILKFKKGTPVSEVLRIMGEPVEEKKVKNARNRKLVFKTRDGNLKENYYEVFFLNGILEWILKTRYKK
jgi:hypothetical protein